MERSDCPISLAGAELNETRHVCALFHNDEEEYRVLLPFIREGFALGHRAVHIVNPNQREDHLQRLSAAGIDAQAGGACGQFELYANTDTYLRDGQFDQDRMMELFRQWAQNGVDTGFPLSRILCRMDWAAEGRTHVDNLIEFESRVNDLWLSRDDAVICTYHLGQFSGDAVIDIVRTHPLVIIGGVLQQNPFFVPPDQFLPEFRERRRLRNARGVGV